MGERTATPEDDPEQPLDWEGRLRNMLRDGRREEAVRVLAAELGFVRIHLARRHPDAPGGREAIERVVEAAARRALDGMTDREPGDGILFEAWWQARLLAREALCTCQDPSAEPPPDREDALREFEAVRAAQDVPPAGLALSSREFSELYVDLRRRAEQLMRNQPRGHTLQATALVNEAYLKLIGRPDLAGAGRNDLFALACRTMRSVLVDHARRRARLKRSGNREFVPLEELESLYSSRSIDLIALDEALKELERIDPAKVRLVELHFFGGLTLEETAEILGIPQRTVERYWALTKAWLRNRIDRDLDA